VAYYRVSFFFNISGFGFSESWLTKASVSESNLGIRVQQYLLLRMAMLRPAVEFAGARLSVIPAGDFLLPGIRASRILVPGTNTFPDVGSTLLLPANGSYLGEGVNTSIEQVRSNLQIRLSFGDPVRSAVRYVVGVSDLVSQDAAGTINFDDAPKWRDAYTAWRGEVLANWAIAGRSTTTTDPAFPVRGVSNRVTNPVLGVTILSPEALGWVIGDLVNISGFRQMRTAPRISLNGRYHVDGISPDTPSTGLTTIYLREAVGVTPSNIKVFGTIRRIQRVRISLGSITATRLGIHKRGKPSLTPRGRRLSRVSLDP